MSQAKESVEAMDRMIRNVTKAIPHRKVGAILPEVI